MHSFCGDGSSGGDVTACGFANGGAMDKIRPLSMNKQKSPTIKAQEPA